MGLAFYRKYRPKTLEEVVGQETIVRIIKNAAKENRIAHGYLFYGPRGTGKTTIARLIAKLLNCEKRLQNKDFFNQGEPCNLCTLCQEINEGVALDLLEIDAASNRGIDEIRNLKENIKIAPTRGRSKVYIIDEAHMLTKEAMNALLKTLEEPPPYVVFILATTELEKLPATITSRTQRFLFKKLTKKDIMQKLSFIAEKEKINIEEQALELIASSAEGSLRDAESLLDQVVSLSTLEDKNRITLDDVESITGRIGFRRLSQLTELILNKDIGKILEEINKISEEGHSLYYLTRDLIHFLRRILSLKLNPKTEELIKKEFTEDEIKNLKFLAKKPKEEELQTLIKKLIRAYSEMRYSPLPSVPLEIALVEHSRSM